MHGTHVWQYHIVLHEYVQFISVNLKTVRVTRKENGRFQDGNS